MKRYLLIIILAGFFVYANALLNSFVWDDEEQIIANSVIKSPKFFLAAFGGSTFNPGGGQTLGGMYYKPLMTFSFGLNYAIWKLNPFGYHFFQIGLHLINAALVYLLLNKLLKLGKIKNPSNLAFFPALIFAIHPINVEAVGYISATQEVLFTLFILLTLIFLLSDRFEKLGKFFRVSCLFLLILLSFLGKETGFLVLPLGLLLLYFFNRKTIWEFALTGTGAFLFYLFLRFQIAKVFLRSTGVIPIMKASFIERLMTLPKEVFYYLKTFVFPKDLAISQHWVVRQTSLENFYLPLLAIIIFTLLVIYLGIKLKNKVFAFLAVWFFISLTIVLNIFPLDMTVAERWFYFPQIGLLGITAIVVNFLLGDKAKSRKWSVVLLVFLVLVFGTRTISRNLDWKNGLTLYQHDINIAPGAFDLENNLGVELFRAGKFEDAKIHFENSIQAAPDWWTAYNNLGVYWERKGDLERASKLYQTAIQNGHYYLAYENLAFVLLRENKPAEAITLLEKSLPQFPQNTRLILALVLAYYQNGEKEKAQGVAEFLYKIEPTRQNRILLEKISQNETLR